MIEASWIIVRDRQAGLLAEAEAERLARPAREWVVAEQVEHVAHPTADRSAAPLTAARIAVGRRLIGMGAALAAEPRLRSSDCPET